MAGFTVAGFDFGQNIENNRIRREQIAASAAASARSAALQARGQDIQKEESEARLAELRASRESADALREQELAERGAAREEGARQFDERMALANRQHDDARKDKEHQQSWDDALNEQRLAGLQQEFDKRNVELERIMAIRQKEDEDRANQQKLVESAYGNAIIATELGGGFLSPGQIEDFNKRNGTNYNYVGKLDPTTGKPFEDGKIHFLTYQLDDNGQVVINQQSGRPTLTIDNPISAEFYGSVMDGYFGRYKDNFGRLSGSSGGRGGLTFDQRRQLQNERIEKTHAFNADIYKSLDRRIENYEKGVADGDIKPTPAQEKAYARWVKMRDRMEGYDGEDEEVEPSKTDVMFGYAEPGQKKTEKKSVDFKIPVGGKRQPDQTTGSSATEGESPLKETRISMDELKKLPEEEQKKWRIRTSPDGKGNVAYRYVKNDKYVEEPKPEDVPPEGEAEEVVSAEREEGQAIENGEQPEEVLTPAEKSVGKEAVAKFKKLHPEVTDVDENPDKYDKQLTRIAQNLSGDYSFTSGSAKKRAEEQRKAQEEKRVAQEKKWQEERDARLKAIDESDKAVVKKVTDMYGPLYEKARDLALEDDGGDYPKAVRKRFAELVKDYNDENDVKFDNFWNPEKNPFGEYHIADLLSDVFGDDAGVYIGPGGYKGRAQRRLKTHKANG